MMVDNPRACLYKSLENDVHLYTFRRATRQAMVEWANFLDVMLPTVRHDRSLLFLVDMRQGGVLNIAQAHATLTRTLMKFPHHPNLRTAILCQSGRGKTLADAALSLFSENSERDVRLLTDDEETALAWLQEVQ